MGIVKRNALSLCMVVLTSALYIAIRNAHLQHYLFSFHGIKLSEETDMLAKSMTCVAFNFGISDALLVLVAYHIIEMPRLSLWNLRRPQRPLFHRLAQCGMEEYLIISMSETITPATTIRSAVQPSFECVVINNVYLLHIGCTAYASCKVYLNS